MTLASERKYEEDMNFIARTTPWKFVIKDGFAIPGMKVPGAFLSIRI